MSQKPKTDWLRDRRENSSSRPFSDPLDHRNVKKSPPLRVADPPFAPHREKSPVKRIEK